jgi:DNA-binding FadR family transcriptional regulator
MSEPIEPIRNPSLGRGLHRGVVIELGRQIVAGSFQPGDVLNMERLEDELSISRSVLREAIRVLSAKGLLEARPKRGTMVCPAAQWNLLDPDVMAWKVRDGVDEQYLRHWDEVRQIIEPQVVRLAAIRRTERDLVNIRAAFEKLSEASGVAREKTAAYVTADLSFHHAILTSTRNDLLVQLGSIMENALAQRDALVHRGGFNDKAFFLDDHQAVLEAIIARDEDGGERAMRALLTQATSVMEEVLPSGTRTSKKPRGLVEAIA